MMGQAQAVLNRQNLPSSTLRQCFSTSLETNGCGRVAFLLPGVRARARGTKAEIAALEGDTLGAKLKRRRVQLGLRPIDVAREMAVAQHRVINREQGLKKPVVSQYPAIIPFPGREPWPEPKTLAEELRAERRREGVSIAQSACSGGVDEGAFSRWEAGKRVPAASQQARAGAFIRN
jgi:transcriptional regulator with XRE-family HTH domain